MNCAQYCPVSKLENILLATDGSEFSEGAIREGINFAKKCSSKLYAIQVVQTITSYEALSPQKIEDTLILGAKNHLESVRKKALNEGVDCEIIIAESDEPYLSIVDEAEKRRADMIIIGRRGRKGLAKLLIGEVAAKVIGYAPCKVLIVPRAAAIGLKNILLATDGSGHSIAAAEEAIGIAKRCGSNIIALSSIRSEEEIENAKANVEMVIEMTKKEGISSEGLTPKGRSYELIIETAGGRGADLIVMGISGKKWLEKLFTGSATEKVITNSGCAVLVIKGEGGKPATV